MLPLAVSTSQPLAFLEPGTYIKDFPGYVLYVGRSRGPAVEEVVVHVLDEKGNMTSTLRARRAEVTVKKDDRKLLLELQDVRGDLHDPADPTNIQKIRSGATASRYPLVLDLKPMYDKALASRKLTDLVLTELWMEIRSLRQKGIHPSAALLEMHQRIAGAVACVAFVLIGIPLGITTSRRETTVGLALSLGLVTLYYFMTVLAGALRDRPHLYPELILWTPNLAFQGLGLWLLWRLNRA
jgi:lipopolysaccharide export system permease protein